MNRIFLYFFIVLFCTTPLLVTEEVKFLAYNVYLRPDPVGWWDYKPERFAELPEAVRPYDVIGLSEVFDDARRAKWVDLFSSTHPYCIQPPHKNNFTNGGIMLFSRYPIVESATTIYRDADNWDYFADKGVIWARIKLPNEEMVEVAVTHAQAGGDYRPIRAKQFQQMQEFLEQKQGNHPLVMLGDFNVRADEGDEYFDMMKAFKQPMDVFRAFTKAPGYTSNGEENPLTGGSGKKRIDYVFMHDHQKKARIKNSAVNKFAMMHPLPGKTEFLSDHYAVDATLVLGAENRTFSSNVFCSPQISLELPKDFVSSSTSLPEGNLSLHDSKGQVWQESFSLINNHAKIGFAQVPSGRLLLQVNFADRKFTKVVSLDSNTSVHVLLPFGSGNCQYLCPSSEQESIEIRLMSGGVYCEKKVLPGEEVVFSSLPEGKYQFSAQVGEKTYRGNFSLKEGETKSLENLFELEEEGIQGIASSNTKRVALVSLDEKNKHFQALVKEGKFFLRGATPGLYKLIWEEHNKDTVVISLIENQEISSELDLDMLLQERSNDVLQKAFPLRKR